MSVQGSIAVQKFARRSRVSGETGEEGSNRYLAAGLKFATPGSRSSQKAPAFAFEIKLARIANTNVGTGKLGALGKIRAAEAGAARTLSLIVWIGTAVLWSSSCV